MPNTAKPATLPRWAVTAGGAPASNISTPPSGQDDTGWTVGQVPPSGWQNFLSYWTYLWILFLSLFFTDGGGAVGNTDLGATAEANLVPLAKYRDYGQNIRSLVDHNGFRMGQVSEIDEHWRIPNTSVSDLASVTYHLPLTASLIAGASPPSYNSGALRFASNSDVASISINLPVGALITSIVVYYFQTNASNVITTTLTEYPRDTSAATTVATKTATGTIATSTDLFVSPTSGHGPRVIKSDHTLTLSVACSTYVGGHSDITDITVTYVVPPPGWTWTGVTTELSASTNYDTILFRDPFATVGAVAGHLNQRMMLLNTTAIGGGSPQDGDSQLLSLYDTGFDADTMFAMEFVVDSGTIDDSAHAAVFDLGTKWQTGTHYITAHYDHTTFSGNWALRLQNTVTLTTIDTGVAVTANTGYRLRLEIFGTNLNSSGHTQAKLYINGVLKATVTDSAGSLPARDNICARFDARTGASGAAAGPYGFGVGRVRRVWNHLASGDNL